MHFTLNLNPALVPALLFAVCVAACAAQDQHPSGIQSSPATPQIERSHFNADVFASWYGPNYHTPFVLETDTGKAAAIPRFSLEYSHLTSFASGSALADLMFNQSSMAEPSAGGGSGATELYAILRSNFGLNHVTRSHAFQTGPLRDVSIEFGANLETKNSSYAPAERTLYVGPRLEFALPRGYLNIGLHFRKEWNHEGVLGQSESYSPNFNIEPAWMLPFRLGNIRLAYNGFADYNTSKGYDSFGTATAPEFLVRNYVAADIGSLLLHKPQLIDLNCGFWYWHNEYGKPSSVPGSEQLTPIFGLALHLDGLKPRGE